MAQVNLTLNQEEILQLLSSGDSSLAFKELLTKSLNQFLAAESASQLKAEPYERSEERQDQRNGIRERPLTTRIGTITLQVPRHRNQPFHTMLFENYQRSESALITTMAEMVVEGVSTRKVAKVMEELCGKEFSKSTVSEACKQLDADVEAFRNRPIEPGRYPFLMADATYFKVREEVFVPEPKEVFSGDDPYTRMAPIRGELKDIKFDETYPYLDKSLKFKIWHFLIYLTLWVAAFPLNRILLSRCPPEQRR